MMIWYGTYEMICDATCMLIKPTTCEHTRTRTRTQGTWGRQGQGDRQDQIHGLRSRRNVKVAHGARTPSMRSSAAHMGLTIWASILPWLATCTNHKDARMIIVQSTAAHAPYSPCTEAK
eukprot:1155797-Pelagomonas_calceolata.AAC.2